MSPAEEASVTPIRPHGEAEQRETILREFAKRAIKSGLRAVVMAELARDLGISTKTLYRHFPKKADLVRSLTEAWAHELAERQKARLATNQPVPDRLIGAAGAWSAFTGRFNPVFWIELERDFPEAYAIWIGSLNDVLRRGRKALVSLLREDLHQEVALAQLIVGIQTAARPEVCDRLGLTRDEAVSQAVRIWARGALRSPLEDCSSD